MKKGETERGKGGEGTRKTENDWQEVEDKEKNWLEGIKGLRKYARKTIEGKPGQEEKRHQEKSKTIDRYE